MRPSESSVENDSIVFTYAQRFSKLPDDDSVISKRVNSKRPIPVAGLSLEKPDSEEHNKDVNSSDTENASPAIAYGPKDINSVGLLKQPKILNGISIGIRICDIFFFIFPIFSIQLFYSMWMKVTTFRAHIKFHTQRTTTAIARAPN